MHTDHCTCGETEPHIIARRSTTDGKHVCLWDDGSLTWALGYTIRGAAQPKTAAQRAEARRAGWLVLGEVCLYSAAEVSELVAAARWAVKRDGLPGTLRKRLHSQREAKSMPTWLRPTWVTYAADRDGKPTLRVWRLHRLSPWAGHAVWRERGQFELLTIRRERHRAGESAETTGIKFATLGAMQKWLAENPPQPRGAQQRPDRGAGRSARRCPDLEHELRRDEPRFAVAFGELSSADVAELEALELADSAWNAHRSARLRMSASGCIGQTLLEIVDELAEEMCQ